MAGSGEAAEKKGVAIHVYAATKSMNRSFYNADGDLLIVPQQGSMRVKTEMGWIHVSPGEIVVVPRGVVFSVLLLDSFARGYMLEIFTGHFTLPELGPLGESP